MAPLNKHRTRDYRAGGRFMRHGRIFGPSENRIIVKRGQYPFMVMIQIFENNKERICTGSLVTQRAVVTSSVCIIDSVANILFYAGNCRYIYPEDFEDPTQVRKLGYLERAQDVFGNTTMAYAMTSEKFEVTEYVSLVSMHLDVLGPEWRDTCFILGYGVSSPVQNDSHVARYMVQRVWTRIGCVDDPPYESYLCAVKDVFNKTTCEGDMGGPLMCSMAPNGHGLFGIVDGRIAMRSRVMDLDCVLPQRENRYLSTGYYQKRRAHNTAAGSLIDAGVDLCITLA
ncbi:granzyme B-like [Schistocerca piceifrons]|uniref:granzyme B-like n=1 Tax=Schistocerca piceifrons TaxID=274613 RepID=UPI001F5F9A20|nr:granzyme B-like [Schistocerca piceifrons]